MGGFTHIALTRHRQAAMVRLVTTTDESFAIGFGLGAVPGALVGSVAGFSRRSERWERVR